MKIDLSIRERLAIGFGLILSLLLLLLGITLHNLHRLDLLEGQLDLIAERADQAVAIQTSFLNESIAIHSYIATRADGYMKSYRTEALAKDDALVNLQKLPKSNDGAEILSRILEVSRQFEQRVQEILPLLEGGMSPTDLPARENKLRELRTKLIGATREFTRLQTEKRSKTARQLEDTRATMINLLLVLSAGIFAFCLLVAVLTTHAIRRPARSLVEAIGAAEQGQYEPALALAALSPPRAGGFRDELHRVAGAFGRMIDTIRRREARLAADNRMTAGLASTLDPHCLAAEALREALDYARCPGGAVYLLDPDHGRLWLAASQSLASPPERRDPAQGLAGRAMALGRCLQGAPAVGDFPCRLLTPEGATPGGAEPANLCAMPLIVQNSAIGVLLLGAPEPLNEDALAFLDHAARHLGISLQNALTHAAAKRLAKELGHKNRQLKLQNEMLQAQGDQLKSQSEQIHARNEELHRQAFQLSSANERLADADRRKDEFLAMLAHELRNPLSAISNANFVLERGGSNPEQAAKMRAVVTRQLRHLSRMVDDLLDVSRITQGKVELRRETLDLNLTVRHALDATQGLIEKHQLELKVTLPADGLWVEADPTRLEQMIGNLLINAVKYTEPPGGIQLSVEREDSWAVLRVKDSGIGIAPEILPHVFELFTQAQSSPDRAKGGLGIGLTMVRALTEMHGGSVQAVSAGIGQGSEFLLRLPMVQAPARRVNGALPPAA